jgi:hypothetical protein
LKQVGYYTACMVVHLEWICTKISNWVFLAYGCCCFSTFHQPLMKERYPGTNVFVFFWRGGGRQKFFVIWLAVPTRDIVFRFIIEYSSWRDFGPSVIIGRFSYEDFWKMIFWLLLKTWD